MTEFPAALAELENHNYELVIVMPNMAGRDIFAAAAAIKERYPDLPIVVLTPFSREVRERIAQADLTAIDYVFAWLGNPEICVSTPPWLFGQRHFWPPCRLLVTSFGD